MRDPCFRATLVAVLCVALVAGGCSSSGGMVRFAFPEGGAVRIGDGPAHAIPWETHLDLGAHAVELLPHGRRPAPALYSSEDSVRGWLVVLESWSGEPAEFAPNAGELAGIPLGLDVRVDGAASEPGVPVFRFKGSASGISIEDPEVRDWIAGSGAVSVEGGESGFLYGLQCVGEGILLVVCFVFIVAIEVLADEAQEDCYCE